jgi:hypothetical protein
MYSQASIVVRQALLDQVWTCLAADNRAQAIRLMAQLAFNLVIAQSDWATKEAEHEVSPRPPEDST